MLNIVGAGFNQQSFSSYIRKGHIYTAGWEPMVLADIVFFVYLFILGVERRCLAHIGFALFCYKNKNKI